MYIRYQKLKGSYRQAVLICHSIRKGDKVSQKTVKYLGVAHNPGELKALQKIAQLELRKLQSLPPEKHETLSYEHIREEQRLIEGPHDIFGTVFDRFHLRPLFSRLRYEQLRNIVIARIATPSSKCRTANLLTRLYAKALSEDQIYRLMDRLTPHLAEVQQKIFEVTKQLMQEQKIDLLFFDVTTLYFESQKADELRDFGYSKDHKIGETQVVLALATTTEGLPIGYRLFSGKTAEVKTLLESLNRWRQEIDIGGAVVIADRAMMSEDNLNSMEKENMRYVVAAKLKQLPQILKREILKQQSRKQVAEEIAAVIQEYAVGERRLIVSYSASRALKDREDRARVISRLQKKVQKEANPRKLITHRGYLKFIDEKRAGKIVINEEKIQEESQWDGLHGVISNDKSSSAEELLSRYRQLWTIEESFRINKCTLAMRPIYHFKKERIEAHILICYLAYGVARYTQYQMKSYEEPMSIEEIREELLGIEASIMSIGKERYKVPSKMTREAKKIYRAMGVNRGYTATKMGEKCSGTQKMQVAVN